MHQPSVPQRSGRNRKGGQLAPGPQTGPIAVGGAAVQGGPAVHEPTRRTDPENAYSQRSVATPSREAAGGTRTWVMPGATRLRAGPNATQFGGGEGGGVWTRPGMKGSPI